MATMVEPEIKIPSKEECIYTSCYCEENVWKLCKFIEENGAEHLEKCFAVFISNKDQMVPIWMQKAATDIQQPVIWDYHVIFVYHGATGVLVYDLDTLLPFPCDFEAYCEAAFPMDDDLQEKFRRKFRVVPAETYLNTFASDRSHMQNEDGTWKADPPDYQCISTTESTMNLPDFISMAPTSGYGEVLDCKGFLNRFGS